MSAWAHFFVLFFTMAQLTMATPTDHRNIALDRAAQIEEVPVAELVIDPWESSVPFGRSIWNARYTGMEPPTERRIAVDDSGNTLWLNDPFETEELFRFIHSEGLVERLAREPDRLVEVFLALHCEEAKVLRRLEDIEGIEEGDQQKIQALGDDFYKPTLMQGATPVLDFWTWSRIGGDLERWHVEIGGGSVTIIRDIVEESVGQYLPAL